MLVGKQGGSQAPTRLGPDRQPDLYRHRNLAQGPAIRRLPDERVEMHRRATFDYCGRSASTQWNLETNKQPTGKPFVTDGPDDFFDRQNVQNLLIY